MTAVDVAAAGSIVDPVVIALVEQVAHNVLDSRRGDSSTVQPRVAGNRLTDASGRYLGEPESGGALEVGIP